MSKILVGLAVLGTAIVSAGVILSKTNPELINGIKDKVMSFKNAKEGDAEGVPSKLYVSEEEVDNND